MRRVVRGARSPLRLLRPPHVAVGDRGTRDPDEFAEDARDAELGGWIVEEFAGVDLTDEPGPAVPHPARFDDPWAVDDPLAPVSNDLAGDVERVLAHLRVQNTAHERPAGRLWDMPADRWDAALGVLGEGGYRLDTTILTQGDTASNDTGYWLVGDPQRDAGLDERWATVRADPDRRAALDAALDRSGQAYIESRFDEPDPWADTSPAQHAEAGDTGVGDAGVGDAGVWAPPERWWARAHSADGSRATFDGSGYYSDAQLAAIAAAREAGDHERAEALQNAPWTAQGATADTAHVAVTDDPAAENYAEVTRGRAEWDAMHGDDPRRYSEMMGDAARAFHDAPRPDVEEDAARREQLTRWHHDDHPDGDHYVTDLGVPMGPRAVDDGVDRHGDGDGDGAGWDR